jgi:hypothetical protein
MITKIIPVKIVTKEKTRGKKMPTWVGIGLIALITWGILSFIYYFVFDILNVPEGSDIANRFNAISTFYGIHIHHLYYGIIIVIIGLILMPYMKSGHALTWWIIIMGFGIGLIWDDFFAHFIFPKIPFVLFYPVKI